MGTPDGFLEQNQNAEVGDRIGVVLDKTSFYAQAGGQIYDTGSLTFPSGKMEVSGVESYAGFVLHMGSLTEGSLTVGTEVKAEVDYERRKLIAPNHTMTHVLNFALRKVLGSTADQRGSLVDEEKLRFDFANTKAVTPDQLEKIEAICKDIVQQKLAVYTAPTAQAEAKKIQGLRAVFGETYPDTVRVVSVGQPVDKMLEDPENSEWAKNSVEFCGGTHISNTEEAGDFALLEESAIAKGIRRIVAATGPVAAKAAEVGEALRTEMDAVLANNDLKRKDLTKLQTKLKKQAKEISKAYYAEGIKLASEVAESNSDEFVILNWTVGTDAKLGREMLAAISKASPDASIMIFSSDPLTNKVAAFTQVSDKHREANNLDAREWVNAAMTPMGGRGGGKDPKNATGQAKTLEGLEASVEASKAFVQ